MKLHYDYCRCHGKDCDRRAECLRHVALSDMGPRTTQSERLCEHGRESEYFTLARDVTPNAKVIGIGAPDAKWS